MISYIIDSSIFIHLHREHPSDIPIYEKLWENIERGVREGEILVSDEVYFELTRGTDLLCEWIKTLKRKYPSSFLESNSRVQAIVVEVMTKCSSLVDPDSDKNHADPFLVACAVLTGAVVVCGEKPRGHPGNPYKLPDACAEFGVRCIKYMEFAREFTWVI